MLGLNDSAMSMMITVGVGHSLRYCNAGYLKDGDPQHSRTLTQSPKGDIEPNHSSEINPNSDSISRSDGRSRRYCNTG